MARDVAQRDLDLSGFRILRLGDPQEPGDMTKTDNATVPLAGALNGSAGQSLLAAPADHVHPIASNHFPFVLGFYDPTEQLQVGPQETLVAQFPVEFPAMPLGFFVPILAAVVDVDSGTATFNLRFGADPDVVDGVILTTIVTVSPSFELKGFSGNPFGRPDVPGFLKITASNDTAGVACRIKNKTVVLKTAF
jgi:hypothetical protein